jgi:uncharacterized membrane protein
MNFYFELDTKRIQALTDASFAVAMTILVLEIKIAPGLDHHGLIDYLLTEIKPALLIYSLSFIIIGAFWIDSHYHHNLITKTDRFSSWANIFFLMFICIVPFSSNFLTHYLHDRSSIIFYALNLICVNLCHWLMLTHSWKKDFIKPHISTRTYQNIKKRIMIPVLLYFAIIPLSYFLSKWVIFLFIAPLLFQIFFGRSEKELIPEQSEKAKKLV